MDNSHKIARWAGWKTGPGRLLYRVEDGKRLYLNGHSIDDISKESGAKLWTKYIFQLIEERGLEDKFDDALNKTSLWAHPALALARVIDEEKRRKDD